MTANHYKTCFSGVSWGNKGSHLAEHLFLTRNYPDALSQPRSLVTNASTVTRPQHGFSGQISLLGIDLGGDDLLFAVTGQVHRHGSLLLDADVAYQSSRYIDISRSCKILDLQHRIGKIDWPSAGHHENSRKIGDRLRWLDRRSHPVQGHSGFHHIAKQRTTYPW